MKCVETIVIIQPGAIGDVVMGTPVAAALKRRWPDARLVYLTHASLFELLRLCPAIDDLIAWNKNAAGLSRWEAFAKQLDDLKNIGADLVVDLTGSLRTRTLAWLSGAQRLTFKKQPRAERPVLHVCDQYMATLAPLDLPPVENYFPTLEVTPHLVQVIKERVDTNEPLLAIVPGVGKHRPNRAWPLESWRQLCLSIAAQQHGRIVLVGGKDDLEAGAEVERALGGRCLNFVGQLSLPETAALLKLSQLVVSADTGPSHIAVAVGTKVIGLTGPTWPQRSGPYGMGALGLNVCEQCQCTTAKRCLLNDGTGAGACMNEIKVAAVLVKLEGIVGAKTGVCD